MQCDLRVVAGEARPIPRYQGWNMQQARGGVFRSSYAAHGSHRGFGCATISYDKKCR